MERKYQIFISSTSADLMPQRKKAVEQILNNYHIPMSMEHFSASDTRQWATIKKAIDSSDLFILIVGYRYGSLDKNGLSFTEHEYQYAIATKKPVIVFVKEDEELLERIEELKQAAGDEEAQKQLQEIYQTQYDEDQERIARFRETLFADRIVTKFSGKKDIDVQSAILKKIKELPNGGWVPYAKAKWEYLTKPSFYGAIITLVAIAILSTYLANLAGIRSLMKTKEEELFNVATNENLEFSRVLPDGDALVKETSLAQTFEQTQKDFWIYTTAFSALKDYYEPVSNAARRGVRFHVLLLDTSSECYTNTNKNCFWGNNPVDSIRRLSDAHTNFNNTMYFLHAIKDSVGGNVQVRLSKKPLYCQMWIKDPKDQHSGLAHFNISHYDGFKPAFRVTPTSSKRLFERMVKEFQFYWEDNSNIVLMK